ncbi:MAG: FkbM family methyltransferase [Pseudomonadota bacterium]
MGDSDSLTPAKSATTEDTTMASSPETLTSNTGESLEPGEVPAEAAADTADEAAGTEATEKPEPRPAPPSVSENFGSGSAAQSLKVFDSEASRASTKAILEGARYTWPEGVKPPQVIFDIGAYVGAASLAFAQQFPDAKIHAFEPNPHSAALARENLAGKEKVELHEIAIWSKDEEARKLYDGKDDPLTASVVPSTATGNQSQPVKTEMGDNVLARLGFSRLDGLKISTGGSEVAVLESLIRHMESTPVVFIAYHSETDRRRIDLIICATHMLLGGEILGPHQGYLCYGLRRTLDRAASGDQDATRLHRTPHK